MASSIIWTPANRSFITHICRNIHVRYLCKHTLLCMRHNNEELSRFLRLTPQIYSAVHLLPTTAFSIGVNLKLMNITESFTLSLFSILTLSLQSQVSIWSFHSSTRYLISFFIKVFSLKQGNCHFTQKKKKIRPQIKSAKTDIPIVITLSKLSLLIPVWSHTGIPVVSAVCGVLLQCQSPMTHLLYKAIYLTLLKQLFI